MLAWQADPLRNWLRQFPDPSQILLLFWQSVPTGALVVLHCPSMQVAVSHSLVTGQSVEALQPTQTPWSLQTEPPLSLQEVPGCAVIWMGTPLEQLERIQLVSPVGTSASSLTDMTPPAPSQTNALQSPAT